MWRFEVEGEALRREIIEDKYGVTEGDGEQMWLLCLSGVVYGWTLWRGVEPLMTTLLLSLGIRPELNFGVISGVGVWCYRMILDFVQGLLPKGIICLASFFWS